MLRVLIWASFLLLVVGGFTGGILGYTRQQQTYSCLNFGDLAIQLDTSLYQWQRVERIGWNFPITSPDGRYELLYYHSPKRHAQYQSAQLSLLDRHRGKAEIVQGWFSGQSPFPPSEVRAGWSPNSQYFYFYWNNESDLHFKVINTRMETIYATTIPGLSSRQPRAYWLSDHDLVFVSDREGIWLIQPHEGHLHHESTVERVGVVYSRESWDEIHERLAYLQGQALVVISKDGEHRLSFNLNSLSIQGEFIPTSGYIQTRWMPGGNYLALMFMQPNRLNTLLIFRVEAESIQLSQILAWPFGRHPISDRSDWHISNTEPIIAYYVRPNEQYWGGAIWTFDARTHKNQRLVDEVYNLHVSGDQITVLHKVEDHYRLDLFDINKGLPQTLIESPFLADQWSSFVWMNNGLLFAHYPQEYPYTEAIVTDNTGQIIWQLTDGIIHQLHAQEPDYFLLDIEQTGERRLQILETYTGNLYPVPQAIANALGMSPNRESVVTQFTDVFGRRGHDALFVNLTSKEGLYTLYHVDLTNNTWRAIHEGIGFMRRPTWSPDGARIAFLQEYSFDLRHYIPQSLYTFDTDGRNERYLGEFAGYDFRDLVWTNCALQPS